jgi:hypothetical protein
VLVVVDAGSLLLHAAVVSNMAAVTMPRLAARIDRFMIEPFAGLMDVGASTRDSR